MERKEKARLMEKFGIKEIGGGSYEEGFITALELAEKHYNKILRRRNKKW